MDVEAELTEVLRTLPNLVVGQGRSSKGDLLTVADQARLRRYQEYLDWYNGKQWAKERRGWANLVLNYCRAVVDKGVSYLLGEGLSFSMDPRDGMAAGLARSAEELIYRVYEDSEPEAKDIQAATNGAVLGDAVYKVFWDRDRGLPRVVNQDPMRFFANWAEDDLPTLIRAHCVYRLTVEAAGRRYGDGGTGEQEPWGWWRRGQRRRWKWRSGTGRL